MDRDRLIITYIHKYINASPQRTETTTTVAVSSDDGERAGTLFPDRTHSEGELRLWLIGRTDDGRHITVPFTIRDELIRPITAWTTKRKYRRWTR